MTLLVRNEEDVLDSNILYHLHQGVDFIIATDNRSEDRTLAILRRYEAQGFLRVIDEPGDDYSQSKWVTRMARLAASEYNADWVINADADEFWWPSRGNLKTVLSSLPKDVNVVSAARYNFPPIVHQGSRPFFTRMVIRETSSYNEFGKPLPPKMCHRGDPLVVVEQGNHAIGGPYLAAEAHPIEILHFPIRSYDQFERKIRLGGSAYRRNTNLPPEVGRTWRFLYDLYLKGELRARYDRDLLTEERIAEGIARGALVRDYRLRDLLTALG